MVCARSEGGSEIHKIKDFGISCMRPANDSLHESGQGFNWLSRSYAFASHEQMRVARRKS